MVLSGSNHSVVGVVPLAALGGCDSSLILLTSILIGLYIYHLISLEAVAVSSGFHV